MAPGKVKKNNKATKHVDACLEASRDGGSNPPASTFPFLAIFPVDGDLRQAQIALIWRLCNEL